MALVKCVECKKEISSSTKICPHCGKKNPTVSFKDNFIALIFLIGIVVFAVNYCSDGSDKNDDKVKKQSTSKKQNIQFLSNEEKVLYEKIRQIPAVDIVKNRDGYKNLLELNPNSSFYKKKYKHYNELLVKTDKEKSNTINITINSENSTNDKALIKDYNFMNKNIGVYKTPTIITEEKHVIIKTWNPYIEATASLAAKFSGENGADKIRNEYGKSYEFTYDERWEMISKDRFNSENVPDMLVVYFKRNSVIALLVNRYFSYNPNTKIEIAEKGYKTIQIIPRREFLELK